MKKVILWDSSSAHHYYFSQEYEQSLVQRLFFVGKKEDRVFSESNMLKRGNSKSNERFKKKMIPNYYLWAGDLARYDACLTISRAIVGSV